MSETLEASREHLLKLIRQRLAKKIVDGLLGNLDEKKICIDVYRALSLAKQFEVVREAAVLTNNESNRSVTEKMLADVLLRTLLTELKIGADSVVYPLQCNLLVRLYKQELPSNGRWRLPPSPFGFFERLAFLEEFAEKKVR